MEVASCLRVAAEGCAGLQHPSLRPPRCDSIEFTLIRTKSFTGGPLRIGCTEDDGAESRAEAGKNPRPSTKHGHADHTKNETDATAKQQPTDLESPRFGAFVFWTKTGWPWKRKALGVPTAALGAIRCVGILRLANDVQILQLPDQGDGRKHAQCHAKTEKKRRSFTTGSRDQGRTRRRDARQKRDEHKTEEHQRSTTGLDENQAHQGTQDGRSHTKDGERSPPGLAQDHGEGEGTIWGFMHGLLSIPFHTIRPRALCHRACTRPRNGCNGTPR